MSTSKKRKARKKIADTSSSLLDGDSTPIDGRVLPQPSELSRSTTASSQPRSINPTVLPEAEPLRSRPVSLQDGISPSSPMNPTVLPQSIQQSEPLWSTLSSDDASPLGAMGPTAMLQGTQPSAFRSSASPNSVLAPGVTSPTVTPQIIQLSRSPNSISPLRQTASSGIPPPEPLISTAPRDMLAPATVPSQIIRSSRPTMLPDDIISPWQSASPPIQNIQPLPQPPIGQAGFPFPQGHYAVRPPMHPQSPDRTLLMNPYQRVDIIHHQRHATVSQRLGPRARLDESFDPSVGDNFPNPGVDISEESTLPCHPLFRPNMEIPRTKNVELPKHRKKQTSTTKESMISDVNSKTEELIEELSSKEKFLPEHVIRKAVLDLVRQANQRSHNQFNIHWKDIIVFNEYSKLHGRIEELIKVYCLLTPITTLHELGIALAQSEKVDQYEDLHLGPLIKHPRAKDLFKPPEDIESAPVITAYDLHKHLTHMITKNKRKEKFNLEDFLEYVRKKVGVEDVEHLCVRVRSFPLAIQINFRFRTSQTNLHKAMEAKLQIEMESLLEHETGLLKRKFSDPRNNDPLSVMKELAGKDPVQILINVFEACQKYFSQFHRIKLDDFIQTTLKNKKFRHLFLLAIYKGAYSADKLFPSFFEEHSSQNEGSAAGIQQTQQLSYRTEGEVFSEISDRLKRLPPPIDLTSLASIEKDITDRLQVSDFSSLGNGPFLDFIVKHSALREELGGGLIGSSSGAPHFEAVKEKALGIVHQLRHDLKTNEEVISTAITTQLSVATFQELGYGSIQKLISNSQKFPSSTGGNHHTIAYLSPLLLNSKKAEDKSSHALTSDCVGILGHQSRNNAFDYLAAAPLLEDLGEWSHWELVFQPQFGSLSNFLNSPDNQRIFALEVGPGRLLKINPKSSIQDFIRAVNVLNPIATAGSLVSLIVQRGNMNDIAPQLLSNHITAALEKAKAGWDKEGSEKSTTAEEEVLDFIFKCLLRIPLKICRLIGTEIFIDPLRKATSSLAVSDLIKRCVTTEQRRFFQALGMVLGNKHWAEDMKVMVKEAQQETELSSRKEEESPSPTVVIQTKDKTALKGNTSKSSGLLSRPDIIPTGDGDGLMDDSSPSVPSSGAKMAALTTPRVEEITKEELAEKEAACKEVIETIRHEEFGIGIKLDDEQQQVAEKQREREGRGIKRLSLELYSKDTHFVLELIQNADDNSYPLHLTCPSLDEQGDTFGIPSLKFVVSDRAIVVLNNEVGFSKENIRAICDVGKSTKGAHRSGYIGQKGIGFKSVFRITDVPAIHSNGFHIKFDASSDPIGFILPHWCADSEGETEDDEMKSWTTRIMLPLKKDLVASNMAKKFNDVQPSLLLFLHRLRSITVEDKVSCSTRHMVRQDRETGVVEIQHTDEVGGETTDRWLVVKKVLDNASKYKVDVEATELALAFPLPPDISSIVLSKDLQQQEVFAFLPLRSYGFRFIVQGDFDLPSSRECVTSDSSWNQWLREEIPSLFLQGLHDIKAYTRQLPNVTDIEAVALFLQFIPLEGELLDFFQPLTAQILNLLRGTNCLPIDPLHLEKDSRATFQLLVTPASKLDLNEEVHWTQPSQILFVQHEFIREHVSQILLTEALNLSYLHSSLLPCVNPSLQSQLNIRCITIDHLKAVAEVIIQRFHLSKKEDLNDDYDFSDDDSDSFDYEPSFAPSKSKGQMPWSLFVKWITNWLACVHMIMEDSREIQSLLVDKLKDLPILPLENKTFATAAESGIFFPPDHAKGSSDEDDSSSAFKEIYSEMKVLNLSLFDEGDDLVQSRVRKVLELIGVKNLHPIDVIRHHILPQFKLSQQKNQNKKQEQLLCKYLQYIKDYTEKPGSGVREAEMVHLLKDTVVLLTNKGPKLISEEVIHFSSDYGCKPDIVAMFPDMKWTVVMPTYMGKSPKGMKDQISWLAFLEKIGVKRNIVVEKVNVKVKKGSKEWKALRESSFKRLPDVDYTLRDWQSCELEGIVKSVAGKSSATKISQMKKLAEHIDHYWDSKYKESVNALIYDAENREYFEASTASSFSKFLVQQPWLPSSPDDTSGSKVLYKGSKLFDRNSGKVQKLLHAFVPYVDATLRSPDFIKHLGIRTDITREEVMEYLLQWSEGSCDVGGFRTSINHMYQVYMYLTGNDNFLGTSGDSNIIVEKFKEDSAALIFVPNRYDDNIASSSDVEGKFLSIHDVCWSDPTTVLYTKQKFNWSLPNNLPKILSLFYSQEERQSQQMKEVFINKIGIGESPLIGTLIALLKYNSSQSAHPEMESIRDFTSIVFELVKSVCDQPVASNYMYNNLKNARVFPSHNGVWVTLEKDCLFENDDPDLAKTFSQNNKVHLLQWPKKISERKGHSRHENQENKDKFLKLCKIPVLSSKVQTQIDPGGNIAPMEEFKGQLSLCIPLIQCFIFHNCKQQYNVLLEEDIAEKLRRLQIFSVQELKRLYYIDSEQDGDRLMGSGITQKHCELDIDVSGIPTIYVSEKKKDKANGLLREPLMKLFMSRAEDREKTKFKDFLYDLLMDLPSKKSEVEEKAKDMEVPADMHEDEEVWMIPSQMKFESEEEESSSEEEDIVIDKSDDVTVTEDSKENKPLTSWPPRAAVDPSSLPRAKGKAERLGEDVKGNNNTTSSDVVGEEDLKELRKKYFPDSESEPGQGQSDSSQVGENIQQERRIRDVSGSHLSSDSSRNQLQKGDGYPLLSGDGNRPPHHQGCSTAGTQLQDHVTNPAQLFTSMSTSNTGHSLASQQQQKQDTSLPHATQGTSNAERSYQDHTKQDSTDPENSSHKPQMKNSRSNIKYPTTWQSMQSARNEVPDEDLVDIQHLVDQVRDSNKGNPIIPLIEISNTDDKESRIKIGRWGEEFVYEVLRRKGELPNGDKIKKIVWVNETSETGMPYDIEIETDAAVDSVRVIYVEVKSTAASNKDLVEFSWQELKYAERMAADYHLYRVYNAGKPSHRLCQLEDVQNYLHETHTRLLFFL